MQSYYKSKYWELERKGMGNKSETKNKKLLFIRKVLSVRFHSVWFSEICIFPSLRGRGCISYHSTTEFLTTLCTALCSNSLQNFWDIEWIESFTYRGDTKNIFYKKKLFYFISMKKNIFYFYKIFWKNFIFIKFQE